MRAYCPTNCDIFLSDCSYEVSRGGNLVNGCKYCMPEGSKTEGQPLYSEGVNLDLLLSYSTFCDEGHRVNLEVYLFIRNLLLQI